MLNPKPRSRSTNFMFCTKPKSVQVVMCTCAKEDNSHALLVDGTAVVVERVLNSAADAGRVPACRHPSGHRPSSFFQLLGSNPPGRASIGVARTIFRPACRALLASPSLPVSWLSPWSSRLVQQSKFLRCK
jgi:hypothetical protein